jgi:hypothetical protein
MVDDLMQLHDYGPDSTVAGMHTRIENTRISFAVRLHTLVIEDAYDLVKMDN